MEKLVRIIDSINKKVGLFSSWFCSLLVLLVCIDVMMRYLFGFSNAFLSELEWHVFALIFLFGAAYTLQEDRHVRVDVWYAKTSERNRALVNLIGSSLFLIPFCLVVIKGGIPYTEFAFRLNEGSPDPGGLPMRFVVKSFIVIGFGLLFLQGISLILHSLLKLSSQPVER